MLFLPGFVSDESKLPYIGYSLCTIYGLYLTINLLLIVRIVVLEYYRAVRRKYFRWASMKRVYALRETNLLPRIRRAKRLMSLRNE